MGKKTKLSVVALAALLATGCAVIPEPMDQPAQRQQVQLDREKMFTGIRIPAEEVSLEEAMARSLKHNLEHRLAMMEGVLRRQQLEASRYDMLPQLAANAGWTSRSNEYLTVNKGAIVPTQSQDRVRRTADLGLTWNVLDFGVSYFQAKQNADQVLIAQERQRKVVNQIVQQVRAAYWRAATAEVLLKEVAPLLQEARKALEDAKAIEAGRLSSPIEALQYQKSLVELIKELELLERDVAVAKAELTGPKSLPPGTPFKVALPGVEQMRMPEWKISLEQMEDSALLNRPELREERYQKRITALDTRKALLKMLPGISLEVGANYDSNSYLVNQHWNETGLKVTWNLLNVLSGPKNLETAESREQVGEMRRLALSMAVLTQVHVSQQQFMRATQNYQQARELFRIEKRIYNHVSNAVQARAQTPLQRIRARLSALYAEVGRYYAYAEVQGAMANLHATLGQDVLNTELLSKDVPDIRAALQATFATWFTAAPEAEEEAVPAVAATSAPRTGAVNPRVRPSLRSARPSVEARESSAEVSPDTLAKIWAEAFNATAKIDFRNPFTARPGASSEAMDGDAAASYADRLVRLIMTRFNGQSPLLSSISSPAPLPAPSAQVPQAVTNPTASEAPGGPSVQLK